MCRLKLKETQWSSAGSCPGLHTHTHTQYDNTHSLRRHQKNGKSIDVRSQVHTRLGGGGMWGGVVTRPERDSLTAILQTHVGLQRAAAPYGALNDGRTQRQGTENAQGGMRDEADVKNKEQTFCFFRQSANESQVLPGSSQRVFLISPYLYMQTGTEVERCFLIYDYERNPEVSFQGLQRASESDDETLRY